MTTFPVPANEKERLNELFDYQILDSPVENEFDDIVQMVARAFRAPLAAITFLDTRRQWVKAHTGEDGCNIDRGESVCTHTILQDQVFEVKDLSKDSRFQNAAYVTGYPFYRYYAGTPLITRKGYHIGALCILDQETRSLSADDFKTLIAFARNVVTQLEIRLENVELRNRTAMQTRLASSLSHDIKSPLNNVKMMLDMHQEIEDKNASPESKVVSKMLRKGVDNTIDLVNNMINWGKLQLNDEKECSFFDLRQLTDEALNEVYNNNAGKYNTLVNAVPENIFVKGDHAGIRFVLRNLLTNACKFTHNGEITVSYDKQNRQPMLQVKDTGMGMSFETTARLNRKQQITHTNGTGNETGHGLGLGLVQEYLARQNKDLFFQSIMGRGTVVSFVV